MAKRVGNPWTGDVKPRDGIVEATKRQLDRGKIQGKLIWLCATCDPYPAAPVDTTVTREIIKLIKDNGNHVQILTKGGLAATRDFDLLDSQDWFGISYAGYDDIEMAPKSEPGAASVFERLEALETAYHSGIKTWISCEPVLDAEDIYEIIRLGTCVDLFRIGKLNYQKSDINWHAFGRKVEELCKQWRRSYYIKHDLRKAMEE